MTGPREILRRAAQRHVMVDNHSSERTCVPAPVRIDTPAGMQMPDLGDLMSSGRNPDKITGSAETGQPICETRNQVPPIRVPVAQNIGGHAIYRELMRSHDRMGTRHIGPRG